MIVTTTDTVPGHQIGEVLGVVRGSSMQGLATILSSFTDPRRIQQMLTELHGLEEASVASLVERAEEMGAEAIIGLRYAPTAFEYDNALKYHVLAYGTAVKLA